MAVAVLLWCALHKAGLRSNGQRGARDDSRAHVCGAGFCHAYLSRTVAELVRIFGRAGGLVGLKILTWWNQGWTEWSLVVLLHSSGHAGASRSSTGLDRQSANLGGPS